jgi:hypothetical protein
MVNIRPKISQETKRVSFSLSWILGFFLLISISINALLAIQNSSLQDRVQTAYVSNETLLRIGDELYQMRAHLRMPSKVMESLLPEVLRYESGNDNTKTGDGGKSHGAGQIQMPTAVGTLKERELTVSDLYNPYVNPFIATEHLEMLFSKFKDVRRTLSAYNGGLRRDSTGTYGIITNPSYVESIRKRAGL